MAKKINIGWGVGFVDGNGKELTHNVTSMYVDDLSMVRLTIERNMTVRHLAISMENARDMGLINLEALNSYLEKN